MQCSKRGGGMQGMGRDIWRHRQCVSVVDRNYRLCQGLKENMRQFRFISTTRVVLILSALIASNLIGCKRQKEEVVVTVLRDNKSAFFELQEHKLLGLQIRQARTSTGKYIIVESVLPSHDDFLKLLSDGPRLSNVKPDLIVLDSPDQRKLSQLLSIESANSSDSCGETTNCPTFIPSWVEGDKLEAAKQVLETLSVK
jgi:hypothetical protein